MNVISTIKSNYVKYLAKAVGATTLGLIAYDSHVIGKLQSDVYAQSRDANVCMDLYETSQRLESPSMIQSKVKDKIYKYSLGSGFLHFINSGIGYFAGFGSMLVDSVVPLGLGLGALLAKNKKAAGTSAAGLGIYALYSLVKDGFGIGNPKFLKK